MKREITWLILTLAFGYNSPKGMAQRLEKVLYQDTVKQDTLPNRDTEVSTYSPLEKFLPPSPQAAALARYGEYPVTLATGVPEISIPLYKIKLGDYSLPISISYHASGIKVDDVASTVGLGWVLNAGGAISRTVVGAPDLKENRNETEDTLYRSYNRFYSIYNSVNVGQYEGIIMPILTDALNSTYDTASDRYSYNFGTKAGVFRYSYEDRTFVTLNHDPILIFYEDRYNNDNGFFTIYDSDGTEYVFKSKERTIMSGSDYMCPTTWYITDINTPYGNIHFKYRTASNYTISKRSESTMVGLFYYYDPDNDCVMSEYKSVNNSGISDYSYSTLLLTEISWNGNKIQFSYSSDRDDIAPERLTDILIKGCDNVIYKSITFDNDSYLGDAADNYRMMLNALSISDEGTYSFTYDRSRIFPQYDCISQRDYWGYYNGEGGNHAIPNEAMIEAYGQFPEHWGLSPTCTNYADRTPNFNYGKTGILMRITYPTGGYTDFSYAQNWAGEAKGGLRISAITDRDDCGNILKQRSFSYLGYTTQDSPSSALVYDTYIGYRNVAVETIYLRYATCSSEPLTPLVDGNGMSVFYEYVTETDLANNYISYHFDYGGILPAGNNFSQYSWPQFASPSLNDEGACAPLLISKVYGQGNTCLRTENYDYNVIRLDTIEVGVKTLNIVSVSDVLGYPTTFGIGDVKSVPTPIARMNGYIKTYRLNSKTVTDDQTGVSITETYTYDPQYRTLKPKTVTKTNSDGTIHRTVNEYPFECISSICDSMYNMRNMADIIVATREYAGNTFLRMDSTLYLMHNSWYYPYIQFEKRLNGPLCEKLRLIDYDSHGKPRTVIANGTDKTALVWGFKSSWPVAKVSGQGYTDLTNLGLTNTLNSIAQDSVPSRMETYLTTLRTGIGSNGLVATYNYKPLYGISTITTESGYATYYDYFTPNSTATNKLLGKLSTIHDSRGPLKNFGYQYAHPFSGNNNTTNHVETTDMLSSSTGKITRQFYDGLGRLIETAQNINGKYVYTMQTYDAKGRVSKIWMPAPNSTTLSYLNNVAGISNTFYGDTLTYSITTYDALDRPCFIQSPGEAWHNAQKGITKECLGNNANSVKCYHAVLNNNSIIENGIYAQNTLYAVKTIDEDGRIVTVFSDKLGRKVLDRRSTDNDTYYIYDDLSQLRYVMPPKAADYYKSNSSPSISAQSTVMLQYGYEYRYDSRRNCIYKRLPGCDPVYYVYDKAGRCILSQDGVQRNNGEWSFSIPDVYGRTVLTGTCKNNINYTNEPFKNVLVTAYRSNASNSILGYLIIGFTPSSQSVAYSANYYDDYSFVGSNLAPSALSYATPPSGDYGTQGPTMPRGLLTGTAVGRIDITGVSGHIYTAIYYDNKNRVIQTRGTNHMGGMEYEYTGYNYIDNVLKRQHVHTASGMTTQTETYTYEYNSAGLLTKTKHKLNTNSEVTLHQYTYNDIGQLIGKTNGGISSAAETYTYNVRSWLKTISSTLFSETLYYNDTYGGSIAQYGGNVSAMTWNADSKTRGYKFTYDTFSRLTKADYMENGSASSKYCTTYSYDKMGNLQTLTRNGKLNDTSFPPIDNLTFTYTGNQVTRIDDSGYTPTYTGAFNFVNGASQSGEYTYDQNGNMTKDLNKNISSISYNLLNLPTNITYSSGKSAAYIYDATGRKLRTSYKASASATPVPTDYCGNMIYENGVLKQILVDGGYMTVTGTPFYYYYLKDHLGSNRVVVNTGGTATQINHYYPFGGLFGESTGNTVQRFRYNGKELDRTHGIDWYDYGARHMTPDAGRFTTIDPLAEKYYNISPYTYCHNNPINRIDPNGMADYFNNQGKYVGTDNNKKDPYIYIKTKNGNVKLSNYNFGSSSKGLKSMMRIVFFYGSSIGEVRNGTSIGVDNGRYNADNNAYAYTTQHHIRINVKDGFFKEDMSQIYNMRSTLRHESIHDKGQIGEKDSEVKTLLKEISHPEFEMTSSSFKDKTMGSLQNELINLYETKLSSYYSIIEQASDILKKYGAKFVPEYIDGGNSIRFK